MLKNQPENKEALFYEKTGREVKCLLCPHNCKVVPGKSGICGVRSNHDGIFRTEIYGVVTGSSLDPIEKKPLYHYYPGNSIFSIGTRGCNMKCPYCQNWHISQNINAHASYISPDQIVEAALNNNSIGIAYTYSEPVIWIEYVLDSARLAVKKGLKNVLVTNGYINKEPLSELLKTTNAMNIDLKTFKDDTYKKIHKAGLADVKNTIETSFNEGCHIEITTLIVTGINDTMDEMMAIADYISSIDKNIPWHISRYYPNYKYDKPETNIDFILDVYKAALRKLNFVYTGNIPYNAGGSDTNCSSCGNLLIKRKGYSIEIKGLKNNKCGKCGFEAKIIS
jgi:pyruvate formate lyase activating enzyme